MGKVQTLKDECDTNWHNNERKIIMQTKEITRMWANAQRDGHPAEYRWLPLFNAAKFGWCPLLEWKPLKLEGVPQTRQQISAVSSPKFTILWGHVKEVSMFNKFFWLSIHALAAKIQPNKVVRWCQNGDFLRPVFSVYSAFQTCILNSH